MESPFDVLRIEPGADDAAIERAFRQRVKEAHPDHGGSTVEFRKVHAAREQLLVGDTGPLERSDFAVDSGPGTNGAAESDDTSNTAEVTYLNYDALTDHGWALEDDALLEKAAEADLASSDYGRVQVDPGETLLEATEDEGFDWPYACRGGACANCAVAMLEGDLSTPVDHILPEEMVDRGIRLSCVGRPLTDDAAVVFNVKHLPELDELRLPPRPFE
ncbi:ferredoxin Fer [Natronosalvus caseinilyticus]|uniref:ferredoxin Fer n=1 Tax=Natronosalvus caseinilyticus TaxID=2953747 RepID=UPI0028A677F6|nr:ferredoxin Fer [Natronosalvus caseinilyticus]